MAELFDWQKAMRQGLDMAMEQVLKGKEVSDVDIMWALLKDAAHVSAVAYRAPPRQGFPSKSAMPDAPDEISEWAKIRAYLNGEIEEMPETETRPPQPTSMQITRAEKILTVWHHVALSRKGNKSRIKSALYLRACGVKPRQITAITGITRQQLHRAKEEAMQEMADFVYGVYNATKCG